MALRILDVSSWQGDGVDWGALAEQGISGGIAKLSEGSSWRDPTFSRNWSAIAGANLARGAYHFCRLDAGTTAHAEAQCFLRNLPALDAGDILVLDMETPSAGGGTQDAFALAWLEEVEKQTGAVPWLYTGRWYAVGLGRLSNPALARHPLWDSAYAAQQPPPYTPWRTTTLWQHTSQASYRGIGVCDESLFAGTVAQFKGLGYPAPKAPAPKPGPAKHLQLDVAMHLRPAPRVDAMPLGRLLPELTCVVELPVPGGGAVEQQGWAHVRTSGDVIGWILLSNAHEIAPDAPGYNP